MATVSNLDRAPVVAHSKGTSVIQLPSLVAGYGDGTVRMFDLNAVKMVLKMHPHAVAVTAIAFSSDGKLCLLMKFRKHLSYSYNRLFDMNETHLLSGICNLEPLHLTEAMLTV